MSPTRLARFAPSAMALATASLIAACNSGGGGDPAPPPVVTATQLKGVVASGAALGGASVSVINSDATTTDPAAVAAAADGSYTINVTGLKAPLGACRAWGWARAGESWAGSLGVGEACGGATQRANNDEYLPKSPRPFGLTMKWG